MEAHASAFLQRRGVDSGARLDLDVRQLRGGLESSVARAVVRKAEGVDPGVPRRFVVKELRGTQRREAEVYRLLWRSFEEPPAPWLFDVVSGAEASYLYLEDVPSASSWPWRDEAAIAAVCRALALLHDAPVSAEALPPWDYESELIGSAEATLRVAEQAQTEGGPIWRRLGDLKRIVTTLPALRARLRESGATVIHGDVHPGNVIVRRGRGPLKVALIDWGRARVASPLEDVSSWLHSLGCWDPEGRRRHDSLLRVYLDARGRGLALDCATREYYWLASASNGLAGAIRYHLAVLSDSRTGPRARRDSERAVREWERVIRGAARVLAATRSG